MNITEDIDFRQVLINRIAEREFSVRTGVHCSDLIYCLNKQALRRLYPVPDTDKQVLLYSIGWATQRWLTGKDKDVAEKEVDGIIVTCDDMYEGCPWELKASYQSSNRPIEQNMNWVHQIQAQCYVMESLVAYLSRFELMGNWKIKEGDRPTLHTYKLEFTQEELDRNWQWLRERKALFQTVLDSGEILPKVLSLPSGQAYECQYCNYKEECKSTQ